ncbi:MAG TPA: hypothetical protein VNR65_03060 [Geobacterales bacterium]|nr:hypothetical protein [Geobacterales bacterium]
MRREHFVVHRSPVEAQNEIGLVEGHGAGRLGSARCTLTAASPEYDRIGNHSCQDYETRGET